MGRPLWVLDMTHGDPAAKPLVVFFTRQHPPEVTGFFAFKAFMQEVMGDSPAAKRFWKNYRVLAFPLVNPDGVDWATGATMPGIDTNRDWGRYRQPEVKPLSTISTKNKRKPKAKWFWGSISTLLGTTFSIPTKNALLPLFPTSSTSGSRP